MTNISTATPGGHLEPTGKVRVTVYEVGFGDCFLLSFGYRGQEDRHVLIDCGSDQGKNKLIPVVSEIEQDCGRHLHALIATHRHRDHINGFEFEDTGPRLEALAPEVVVQPWTEHPDVDPEATTLPSELSHQAIAFGKTLAAAHKFAQQLFEKADTLLRGADPRMLSRLKTLGEEGVKNLKAVERLRRMGEQRSRAYLHADSQRTGLEQVLPGISVKALGPPTVDKWQDIEHQTAWDDEEFWKLQARLAGLKAAKPPQGPGDSDLLPHARTATIDEYPHLKWAVDKLDEIHVQDLLRFVTHLNHVLNNTSRAWFAPFGQGALGLAPT